jgi:hypothetical protein
VPVVVKQPGLRRGNPRGQPLPVPEGHELVLPPVQQQDGNRDIRQVEPPRPEVCAAVLPPSLDAGGQPVATQRTRYSAMAPRQTAESAGVSRNSSRASSSGDARRSAARSS